MTISDYLSDIRFPHTTVKGATLKAQITFDATLFDQYQELKDKGCELTSEQNTKLLELEIKIPHSTRLIAAAWSLEG